MPWQIKQFKNGKYGIWSTIVDAYMSIPIALTKEQAVDFLAKHWRKETKRRIENEMKDFPKGWQDKDTWKIIGFGKTEK